MGLAEKEPIPDWLKGLDEELKVYAEIMSGRGVIKVTVEGGKESLDRNREGVRHFLEQMGLGVVGQYNVLMGMMMVRLEGAEWPDELSDLRPIILAFLDRKMREELVHERQWWRMARAWDVRRPDVSPELHPNVRALREHLTGVARGGSLLHGLFAITFVMDTLSVALGAKAAQELLSALTKDQKGWLESRTNTESNREHAAQVRRFITQLAGPNPNLPELMEILRETAELFGRAVLSAYSQTQEEESDAAGTAA